MLVFGMITTGCPTGEPEPETTTYTVTFNVDGGSVVGSQSVEVGGKVSKPADPSKAGYTFANWYKDAAKTALWNFDIDTVTSDITLYAKWVEGSIPSYTVTFNVDGGSAVAAQTVVQGEKVPKPADPAKAGHTFAGWYKEAAKTTPWNFDADTVTADTTIYAKWVEGAIPSYTVTFNVDGGAPAPGTQTVVKDGKVSKPADPAKANYTFAGWYKEADKTTLWDFDTDTVTANITLYAKWVQYTVTFDSDGGEPAPGTQSLTQGDTVAKPSSNPAKAGYTFAGWYKDAAKTTPWNFDTDTVTEDTTIYAKWLLGDVPIYTVTFNVDGGGTVENQAVVSGGKITKPIDPAKAGNTLIGWYKDEAKTTLWDFDTDAVIADMTLYAKWSASFTVTFNVDGGGTVEKETVLSGGKVTRPADPSKAGNTFAGWYKEAGKTTLWNFDTDTVTAETTLYAKWVSGAVETFTVTFDAAGGAPAPESQSVVKGEKVSKPADPAKTGYVFDGWYNGTTAWNFSAGTVTAAITLTARWIGAVAVTFNGFTDETIDLSHETEALSKGNWDGLTVFLSSIDDAASIRWYIDGATWSVGSGARYTIYASDFTQGPHTLSAVVVIGGVPYSKTLRFQVSN
jgi:uncharacterized repeat protein (TIGR02543 family)